MQVEVLKSLFSRFGRQAFEEYVHRYFVRGYSPESFHRMDELGDGVFFRDTYLEPDFLPGRFSRYPNRTVAAYITHHDPSPGTFDPRSTVVKDPELKSRISSLRNHFGAARPTRDPALRSGSPLQEVYFLGNLSGFTEEDYQQYVIPEYRRLLEQNGVEVANVGVGNFDSFFERDTKLAIATFKEIIQEHQEGLRIEIGVDGVSVDSFACEQPVSLLGRESRFSLYEPVSVFKSARIVNVLKEFEGLLRDQVSESTLEEFLHDNYRTVFGERYDRIERQLWLKFPELDIAGKKRRTDLFIRNCVLRDWELFEIKKEIPIVRTYRDVPVFTSEIMSAVQQVKNYSRLLEQDAVKRHFAGMGIEYFHPTMQLVVGRRPPISNAQWRWLIESNRDVKILTYDDLLDELRARLDNPIWS